MTELDYSERNIADVYVWGLEQVALADGTKGVSGSVKIGLSGIAAGSDGPQITINVGHPIEGDITIKSAERVLVAAALRVLSRCGEVNLDAAMQSLEACRDTRIIKPSEG